MKALLLALGILTLASMACSAPLHCDGEYAISTEFSPEEQEEIIQAGEEWNAFIGRRILTFRVDQSATTCNVRRIHGVEEHDRVRALSDGDKQSPMAGTFLFKTRTVYIYPEASEVFLHCKSCGFLGVRRVAGHELGHALGLGHVESGIMSGDIRSEVTLTSADRQECVRVYVCALDGV